MAQLLTWADIMYYELTMSSFARARTNENVNLKKGNLTETWPKANSRLIKSQFIAWLGISKWLRVILCFQLTKFFIRYIAWLGNGDIINKEANVTRKNGRVSRWSPPVPEIIKINILMMFCRSEGGQLVLLLVIMKALSGNMASVG